MVYEEIIIGILKDISPNDLEKTINSNSRLIEIIKQYPFAKMAKYIINKDEITVENVLFNLKKTRPDLFNVIIKNPNGLNWVRTNVEEIRDWIWSTQ